MNEWVYRIGWPLLDSVWLGAGIAILLAIVLTVARRASTRYVVSGAALIALIAAVLGSAVLRDPPIMRAIDAAPVPAASRTAQPAAKSSAVSSSPQPKRFLAADRALPMVVGIWLTGVIALAAWQLIGWELLRRYRRAATPAPVEWSDRLLELARSMRVNRAALAISDRLSVPIVLGVFRPIILVPVSVLNELSPIQAQAIFAHELAHIRRHDYLANLIQIVIETLFFYHPAVWWIGKQIRRERECCCDAIAADVCGDPVEYARSLATLALIRGAPLAMSATGSGERQELLVRMRRLLQGSRSRNLLSTSTMPVLLIIMVVALGCAHEFRRAPEPALKRNDQAVISTSSESPVTRPATTQSSENTIRLGVGGFFVYLDNKPRDIDSLNEVFNAVAVEKRSKLVLEISIVSPQVTAQQYLDARSRIETMAKAAGIQSIVEVGVREVNPYVDDTMIGEYYMGAGFKRVGVYSLTSRKITLRQAIIGAGMTDGDPNNLLVSIWRRFGVPNETLAVKDLPLGDLLEGTVPDIRLMPDDQIMLHQKNAAPASQPDRSR